MKTGSISANNTTLFRTLLLGVAVLLLAGCIEFAEQTMTYRYDAASDTLLIYQRYTGISGKNVDDGLSEQERGQLDSVLQGERTFFFSNWGWELNLSAWRNELAKPSGPADEAKPPADSPDALRAASDAQERQLLELLVANVHISNGPFYLDDHGRLCGVQRVTVRHATRLLAAGNNLIRAILRAEAASETDGAKAEWKQRLLKSAAQPEKYLTLDGNRLQVRVPFEKDQLEVDNDEDRFFLAAFRRQGGDVSLTGGWLTVTFGARDSQRETLALPFQGRPAADRAIRSNAVPHVMQQTGLATAFDPLKDAERFFSPDRPEVNFHAEGNK